MACVISMHVVIAVKYLRPVIYCCLATSSSFKTINIFFLAMMQWKKLRLEENVQ